MDDCGKYSGAIWKGRNKQWEELYKVMDDLLEVEFQMKAGMDILKELEEFYMLKKKPKNRMLEK